MKILIASLAVAASVVAPSLASAQTYRETVYDLRDGATVQSVSDIGDSAYGALPPFEVLTIVRSMGFEPQSQPILRGRVYIVRAFDDQDIPVRVAIDARSGRVVNVAERGAGRFGQVVEERYGAYPVPPAQVPGAPVYGEPEYRGKIYNGPTYNGQTYNGQVYNGQPSNGQAYNNRTYRGSDATIYSPAPYAPSATPNAAAQRPRVAARTPVTTPVTTPRAKPQATPQTAKDSKPATPPAAATAATSSAAPTTPAPQGAATKTTAPASATSSVAEDTGRRGTSIPAPVASRKVTPSADETTAAKPAQPQASSKPDPSLVPVAPLE